MDTVFSGSSGLKLAQLPHIGGFEPAVDHFGQACSASRQGMNGDVAQPPCGNRSLLTGESGADFKASRVEACWIKGDGQVIPDMQRGHELGTAMDDWKRNVG